MRPLWRKIFFTFGVCAIAVMLLTFPAGVEDVKTMLRNAGHIFPLALLLWLPIYLLNAGSWGIIIHKTTRSRVPFYQIFKMTVSGFALNYTTPFGLMGGEPYRIMELTPFMGRARAASSVLLYAMMHICSHFCFWLTACLVYVAAALAGVRHYLLNPYTVVSLAILTLFFLSVCHLFHLGFTRGFVVKVSGILKKVPFMGKWVAQYMTKHSQELIEVDTHISSLRASHSAPFWLSLFMEYAARLLSCVEYWLFLRLLFPGVTYRDSLILLAFSSLFSNALFFSPMQLGSREGGLSLAAGILSIPGSYGLSTAIMTRMREIVWIVIGLILMTGPHRKK